MKHQNLKATIISGAGDSPDTHKAKWFSKVWADFKEHLPRTENHRNGSLHLESCDPFARDCRLAKYTNDLDENTDADEHKCALEFLKSFERGSLDFILFDPPFSQRQAGDHYKGIGFNLYASDGELMSKCLDEAARIIKPGGFILKFGYNCNDFHPNLKLIRVWLIQKIPHTHNNTTIISLWQNRQTNLEGY